VVFDPVLVHTLEHRTQHSGAPYSLYEGRKCLGKPVFTMQRGKTVMENGEMKKKPGEAKFHPTRIEKIKLW